MTQPVTCLILGATGFIGGQIARVAVERDWHVRCLRRRPGAVGAIGDLNVEWVMGDLGDGVSLAAAMKGCEVAFHCAAAYPHDARDIAASARAAVSQMQTVLTAAREAGVRRLVYTSSYTTIGRPREPGRLADEEDFYIPGTARDPYFEAKWAMEVEALAAAHAGLEVVVLCPAAVFGPGDVHLSVSRPLLMTARGRMPFYVDAVFSVVDVRDAAAAHIAAARQGRNGHRYILCQHNLTMREGLSEIARVAGVRPPGIRLGGPLLSALLAAGSLFPGSDISFLRTAHLWPPLSNAKAVAELGLQTRPFAETVADALAWFRAQGYLRS